MCSHMINTICLGGGRSRVVGAERKGTSLALRQQVPLSLGKEGSEMTWRRTQPREVWLRVAQKTGGGRGRGPRPCCVDSGPRLHPQAEAHSHQPCRSVCSTARETRHGRWKWIPHLHFQRLLLLLWFSLPRALALIKPSVGEGVRFKQH